MYSRDVRRVAEAHDLMWEDAELEDMISLFTSSTAQKVGHTQHNPRTLTLLQATFCAHHNQSMCSMAAPIFAGVVCDDGGTLPHSSLIAVERRRIPRGYEPLQRTLRPALILRSPFSTNQECGGTGESSHAFRACIFGPVSKNDERNCIIQVQIS